VGEKVLSEVPVNFLCFGNHESDVGHAQLSSRINEFLHPRSQGKRQVCDLAQPSHLPHTRPRRVAKDTLVGVSFFYFFF
jgi:hypothetical protein